MSGCFQRRGATTALIISAAATLIGGPTFAQQTGNAVQAPSTPPSNNRLPVAPPVLVPGPPAPPRDPNLPSVITDPSWVRAPSPEYPAIATANGVPEGRATLRCTAFPNGALSGCVVVEEVPEGQGFGAATIAAARRARLSPRTVDGAAEGASVQFTIRSIAPVGEPTPPPLPPSSPLTITEIVPVPAPPQEIGSAVRHLTGQSQRPGPPPAPRDPNLITNPAWDVMPKPIFPQAAAGTIQRGDVTLECFALPTGLMRDCQVTNENPEGLGFGASALIAARTARISQRGLAGTNPGAKVRFVVRFTAPEPQNQPHDPTPRPPDMIMDPPSAPREPSLVTNPSWAVQPMPEYPQTALAVGVVQGRVVQRCIVLSTGWLRDCEIIEETPIGMGFGASALNASATARIRPRTVDGNAEAAMVQFAIRYEAPPAPPVAPIRR